MTAPVTGGLPINYDDPFLYEHLSLIVDEFEKAALRSGSRVGMLVTAQSSLQGMDMILASSDKALGMGRTASATRLNKDETHGPTDQQAESEESYWHNDLELIAQRESGSVTTEGFGDGQLGNASADISSPAFEVGTTGSIGFDADFNDLFGGDGDPNKKGDTIGDYLSQCLGCDLRLQFDWQLQPVDLLGPVADLLADINLALDQFEGFLNPFDYLVDLCDLLNGLNFLCIPDLVMILMSLKMLLKSYLTFQLNIRLDWTLLLGPLLKLILDAISTLLQQIAGVIVAPLDCAIAALMTVANLQTELAQTAALAGAVLERSADRLTGGGDDETLDDLEFTADPRFKNVYGTNETVDAQNEKFQIDIPSIQTATSVGEPRGDTSSFLQGFQVDAQTTLPKALKEPAFLQANPFTKLAVAVKDARDYIMDLVRKLLTALNSLQGLVSGSLGLSISNLGLVLFLKDMINLVLMIIKLLSQNRDVNDWCSYLEENPNILERELNGIRVVPTSESLHLVHGAAVVGEVKTCFNDRSPTQNALLKQWVADLKREGSA